MIHEIKNNKISKKVKLAFFMFALDAYTKTQEEFITIYGDKLSEYDIRDLCSYGLCLLFHTYFDKRDLEYFIPEILVYKPTILYDHSGVETVNPTQFWFPVGENEQRLEIVKKMIESLK